MSDLKKGAAYIEILIGTECPVCKRIKRPHKVFCIECFGSLSSEMQSALYRRMGQGFEEAFNEAETFLKGKKKKVPRGYGVTWNA